MHQHIALAALAAFVTPLAAWAQNAPPAMPQSAMVAPPAADFVARAANSDMFEVESGKLAVQAAQDANLKQFAQKMIDDHTKSTNDLKATLQNAGAANIQSISLPAALDAPHQATLDQLKQAKGAAFYTAYRSAQLTAHKDAVDLFTAYSQGGDKPELKAFATRTLPTIQMHYQMVQQLPDTPPENAIGAVNADGPIPPLPGANSFTEGQARARIEGQGFTNVSALAKDSQGVWQGTALKDGKSVTVSLDFKGNVVAR